MKKILLLLVLLITLSYCTQNNMSSQSTKNKHLVYSKNILDYRITPKSGFDKSGLMFSDQGAWFAYSFPDSISDYAGFSGPFLMTQQNGVWSSASLTKFNIQDITWGNHDTEAFNSHLEQIFSNKDIELKQELIFNSGHSAFNRTSITNKTKDDITINYNWENEPLLTDELTLHSENNELIINSSKTNAIGHIKFPQNIKVTVANNSYQTTNKTLTLKPNETKSLIISQSFIFPEYSWEHEKQLITNIDFDAALEARKSEKNSELKSIINNRKPHLQDEKYAQLLAKTHLTLQNNWRIPAGEIKHEGLFPSYHYEWFNGFWSWDSWKHAVGLSYYNTDLAQKQMKLMFEFQNDDGFIVDCVYRDTLIEAHNYRDTKPPLSAWAVAKIYKKDTDIDFVKYMYPRLKKYHYWWYNKRDNDKDGLCEFGSTDGSLIAAKWESGMDNAIRFDDSKILKNEEGAYSIDQESVDLNAYLYAEKLYLADLAEVLQLTNEVNAFKNEAEILKLKVQQQFYDKNDGWFYDTNLEGSTFIKGAGSEGWTALWANVATQQQAEAVKNKMMDTAKFYTRVPFQTMSADHPKFDPLKGYWRGPNWLDQAYFGVEGLRNYGFNEEANQATEQIIKGAEGLLGKGTSIRENYHPLTGKGLHAKNFSWSAAHIIMLLMDN